MRHRKHAGPKLSRTAAHRRALYRNMLTELFRHEKITTTLTKAKALKGRADKIVTMAKRGDLAARRQVSAELRSRTDHDKTVIKDIFERIAPRYQERNGGYTRVIHAPRRAGDAAKMAIIELVKE